MVTPKDAVSAAIAATSSKDSDVGRKERSAAVAVQVHQKNSSGSSSSLLNSSKAGTFSEYTPRTDSPSPILEEPTDSEGVWGVTSPDYASSFQQRRPRPRRSSLRKSALLGKNKHHVGLDQQQSPISLGLDDAPGFDQLQPNAHGTAHHALANPTTVGNFTGISTITAMSSYVDPPPPRPSPVPPPVPMVTHPVHGDPSKILEVTDAKESSLPDIKRRVFPGAVSSTASTTTDDDDSLQSYSNSDITNPQILLKKLPVPVKDSYFPTSLLGSSGSSLSHLRTHSSPQQTAPKSRSPLASLPPSIPSTAPALNEWDYSETRWWGWFILCATWIVFVVGMGSCFGIWSWAWDVGETPYAPPELEDDPTLPIVGYYPALMVLTCVMAWVWVIGAWVGMKYFRHANITGDDE